jgi:hypothetical protein
MIVTVLALAGLSLPHPVVGQGACDPKAWTAFLAEVQALGKDSERLGQSFLRCGSQTSRDAAVYWLSFYYAKTAQTDRIPLLVKDRNPLGSGSKAQALYRAWQGDPLSLRTRIQAGEAGLVEDLEVQLVLARTAMRARLFKEGLDAYQTYLRQADNEDTIEAERVFAYIWADDEAGARAQIAALRRFDMSPPLKQSLLRAEELLAEGKASSPETPSEAHWIQIAARQAANNKGYNARSWLMLYEGWVDVELEASEERSDIEAEAHRLAYFQLAKLWKPSPKMKLATSLGYLSVGKDNLTGHLGLKGKIGEQGSYGLGLYREPLVLQNIALIDSRLGTLRDSLSYQLGYGRKVEWKAAIRRDGPKSFWYEDYKLLLRFGSQTENQWASGLNLLVPFAYKAHPQPSRDYISYPREIRGGLGLELTITDGANYRWVSDATFETIQGSSYYSPSSYARKVGATFRSEMRTYIRSGFFLFGKGEWSQKEKGKGEKSDLRKSVVLLGLAYQDQTRGGAP